MTTPIASTIASARAPGDVPEGGEVKPGHVTFVGMIRPAKDGFHVGAVTVTEHLRERMRDVEDVKPADPEWFVGAKVKLTGQVERHEDHPMDSNGIVSQGHDGSWLAMDAIERVELVAMPVVVEGTLAAPPPGATGGAQTFAIGDYLVTADDLAWSLVASGGAKIGARVRLVGQPRPACDPRGPCPPTMTPPIFDVARASKP